MSKSCLYVIVGVMVWSVAGLAASLAQDGLRNRPPTTQEYIRSASPLPDGGTIVSQADRGGHVQTVTMIASLPVANQTPAVGFQSYNGMNGVNGAQRQSSLAMAANYPTTGFGNAVSGSYLYPAAGNQPTNTLGFEPIGNRQVIPTTYSETEPNWNGQPTLFAPANPAFPASSSFPTSPFQTSNRVQYAPLISLRNLPPGTYVGQGIIGQPKAYVDGEPVRNLLRYIFP